MKNMIGIKNHFKNQFIKKSMLRITLTFLMIIFKFRMWISPIFKLLLIKEF